MQPKTHKSVVQRRHCLYAVFDRDEQATAAERALTARGIQVTRPDWAATEWSAVIHPSVHVGVWRALQGILRDFNLFAREVERYDAYAAGGRTVVVVCDVDRARASRALPILAAYGADDITYFGDWVTEYPLPLAAVTGETAGYTSR